MNQHKQNADVIDAAADRIFERGWFGLGGSDYTGATYGPPSSECAFVALSLAAMELGSEFFPVLMAVSGSIGGDIPTWNDAQPDADTVIAKLRECADAERAKAWDLVPA